MFHPQWGKLYQYFSFLLNLCSLKVCKPVLGVKEMTQCLAFLIALQFARLLAMRRNAITQVSSVVIESFLIQLAAGYGHLSHWLWHCSMHSLARLQTVNRRPLRRPRSFSPSHGTRLTWWPSAVMSHLITAHFRCILLGLQVSASARLHWLSALGTRARVLKQVSLLVALTCSALCNGHHMNR